MNKAKAMLDALMGPSRDTTSKPTSDDWKDRRVCKTFLVAVCPYDKTMLGGRKGTEVCPKIHNEMLREAFNKHADGAADSSFRRDCEDRAFRELSEALAARDQWAREQASIKNAQLNIRPGGQNKEIGKMKRQVCEMKEKADLIDDTESMAQAALKAQLLKEYAEGLEEYEAFVKEEERKADANAPRAQTCKVCGTAYADDDAYKLHLTFTRHTSYVQIQEQHDRIQEKKAAYEKQRAEEKAKKEQDRKNGKRDDNDEGKEEKKPRDIGKEEKKPRDIGKEEKADKKRSRSRSKDKDKDRDKAKEKERNGDKRSRSRDKDKGREKERNRDRRSKDRDTRRRDRSRSRGDRNGRKRSRSRSRSRRRDTRDRRR